MVVEVRAKLNAIKLNDGALPAEPETLERDPLEDEAVQPPHYVEVVDASPAAEFLPEPMIATDFESQTHIHEGNRLGDQMAALFGELWPLSAVIKLDPTIDRAAFRVQKDHLKSMGYRFQASTQTWMLEGV